MPKFPSKAIESLKASAKDKAPGLNTDSIKEKAAKASGILSEKAGEIRDSAVAAKEDIWILFRNIHFLYFSCFRLFGCSGFFHCIAH